MVLCWKVLQLYLKNFGYILYLSVLKNKYHMVVYEQCLVLITQV